MSEFFQYLKDDLGVDPNALSAFLREQGVDLSRIASPAEATGDEGEAFPVEVEEGDSAMGTVAHAAMGRVREAIVAAPVAALVSQSVRDQHVASAVASALA